MLYCRDCKYFDKTKEGIRERKIFYNDNKYDIVYEDYGWCLKNKIEAIPSFPLEYCDTIKHELIENRLKFYIENYGEFYDETRWKTIY